ncbi:MAG: serine hydrolase [Gammaproteobacteria bacterium]|nr:serine hydrolase [Gammaproteobacteria bacterium]
MNASSDFHLARQRAAADLTTRSRVDDREPSRRAPTRRLWREQRRPGLLCGGLALLACLAGTAVEAYPIYGSEQTGIRRLEGARLMHEGEVRGPQKRAGETLPLASVDLRLTDRPQLELPAPDPEFNREIVNLLGGRSNVYSLSVLDLSDPDNPRYAEHAATQPRNPGSVGKIMVGLALFQALAEAWPEDLEARMRVLRETRVTATDFIVHDSHTVRFWDGERRKLTRRPLRIGDQGSLFEFLDWMLSASSNAAASVVLEQAMLLKHFGKRYPVDAETARAYFEDTPKADLSNDLEATIQAPLTRYGLDLEQLRQGSFFTRRGKQKVPGTSSYGTTRELMRLLVKMEQGKLVDAWSSRELKRLLYMTERRIRYASSPALNEAAVYFKSGSLYKCVPEPEFVCKKYHGNAMNLMNSVAIVEAPAQTRELYYIVTLTSNVLRKNSAVDHQSLATRIHRLIERRHGADRK